MPKISKCSFLRCDFGLRKENRENFRAHDEYHWRACHVDEPFTFTCPHSKKIVQLHRDPKEQHKFVCICHRSRLLNTASMKRHFESCAAVREAVSTLEPSSPEACESASSAELTVPSPSNSQQNPSDLSEGQERAQSPSELSVFDPSGFQKFMEDFYDFSTEMKSWMSSMDNNIKNMQRAMQLHPHGPYLSQTRPQPSMSPQNLHQLYTPPDYHRIDFPPQKSPARFAPARYPPVMLR